MKNVYALGEAERTAVRIHLLQGHTISGQVTSADGQPVAAMEVEAVPSVANGARKTAVNGFKGTVLIEGVQGRVTVNSSLVVLKQRLNGYWT